MAPLGGKARVFLLALWTMAVATTFYWFGAERHRFQKQSQEQLEWPSLLHFSGSHRLEHGRVRGVTPPPGRPLHQDPAGSSPGQTGEDSFAHFSAGRVDVLMVPTPVPLKDTGRDHTPTVAAPAYPSFAVFGRLDQVYQVTYDLMDAFERNNLPVCLTWASHLGADRHHGIIPFSHEKDVDLALFSTDTKLIEHILDEVPGLSWQYNMDGQGLGGRQPTFGYDIRVPASRYYIDIWLYEKKGSMVHCVGVNDGCKRWWKKYILNLSGLPPLIPKEQWFPFRQQVFGTRTLAVPRSNQLLVRRYGRGWRESCWDSGPCASKYNDYPFVFQEDDAEVLKIGPKTIHVFHPRPEDKALP